MHGPTPLHRAPRLAAELGVDVWFKRDDLTGLGLGGNKVRGLEYLLGDALERGSDCLVTGAGPQSNWAMLAALAARRCGLDPFLVYYGPPVASGGNLMLAELVGAEVHFTGELDRSSVDSGLEKLRGALTEAGRRPYVVPRGGATALGAVGYLLAAVELDGQLADVGLRPSALWLATGSCGTQAGLVAAGPTLPIPYRVVGVTTSRPVDECVTRIRSLAAGAAEILGVAAAVQHEITVLDGYLGPGYGHPSAAGAEAARLVARTEGLFLDPVFGAKAMAALVDAARAGRVDGPVVFLVTGGAPTLFGSAKASM
jgi:D-cysteine desulfhydrase